MIVEDRKRLVEVEIPLEALEELTARSKSMGLTVSEYVNCVMGRHVGIEETV